MPEFQFSDTDNFQIAQILKSANLVSSTSEGNRMIDQGAVKLDGEKILDKTLRLSDKKTIILQVGKRKFAKVTLN